MTTRKQDLIGSAHYVGLCVETYSPGDGVTRYRFFNGCDARRTYFGPADGIHTSLGIAAAEEWMASYAAGRSAGLDSACGIVRRHCAQCGRDMNPVDFMVGPVCLPCCRDNQRKAADR